MKKIKYLIFCLLMFSPFQTVNAETIIMSFCNDDQDEFLKNEYILNLDDLVLTRNYVYKENTYQKYKKTDLSIKKSNSFVMNIYEEGEKILTYKHGYPQFYTQIMFEKGKSEIFIKTVLNDEEGISKISTCEKIENFKKES